MLSKSLFYYTNILFFVVFIKSFPRLHPKFPLGHQLVNQLAWSPEGKLRVVVDVLVEVDPSVVQELEGPHGISEPQLDSNVHILVGGVPPLHHGDGVADVGS